MSTGYTKYIILYLQGIVKYIALLHIIIYYYYVMIYLYKSRSAARRRRDDGMGPTVAPGFMLIAIATADGDGWSRAFRH